MRRYLPKNGRRGVLGFNTPRSEPRGEPDEELDQSQPEIGEDESPWPPVDDGDESASETAMRVPRFGPGRSPGGSGRPGCPGGPNWPPWCPGTPPCPPGTGPGVPCPPGGIQLATAWVPWQVYNGYVNPCEMAGPGTIFPELLTCPPLYQKPPGT